MKSRKVLVIDVALVVLTFGVIAFFAFSYYNHIQFSPAEESKVLFDFSKDSKVFISEDKTFTSLEEIKFSNGFVLPVKQGNYYLKISSGETSKILTLSVAEKEIKLKFLDFGERYGVVNAEDFALNVEVHDKDNNIVDNFGLSPDFGGENG